MKLQLKDSKKTVITSFDTEIKYYHIYEEGRQGYLGILEINGMTLRYEEKTYANDVKKDFQKLINKGARKVWESTYISEQEQGYIDGMTADAVNPTLHGRELYSILAGEHSGRFVRDYFRQTSCNEKDLIIPSWELRYPEYKHDCKECIYLGFYEGADLYFCSNNKKSTLVIRYSENSCEEYLELGFPKNNKFIEEAKKRAIEVGILEKDEPQQKIEDSCEYCKFLKSATEDKDVLIADSQYVGIYVNKDLEMYATGESETEHIVLKYCFSCGKKL